MTLEKQDLGWLAQAENAELPAPEHRIYCNRTLNLRGIRAVGFDMDYTLAHYHVEAWERRAFSHLKNKLETLNLPVADLEFDAQFTILGLIIDTELGNVVKADRFGFVKRVAHGTRMMDFEEVRKIYATTVIDLSDKRWMFVNTLFAMSEASMYAQLVDRFDAKLIPDCHGYSHLYDIVRANLDAAHMEGKLKADILAQPDLFVDRDPQMPLALRDLRAAGKKVLLVTNSEWAYTDAMMGYLLGDHLRAGETWRSFFDLIVVGARKPSFFTDRVPAFEVIDDEGRLFPVSGKLQEGKAYLGGHARLIENSLGISGQDILYFGDHIFADVNVSKATNRWRTGLVLRDLENELKYSSAFAAEQAELRSMMKEKEVLEHRYSLLRIGVARTEDGVASASPTDISAARAKMRELRTQLVALDERIAPLARRAGELSNARWGLLLRAGNDKSHLARQVERHADVYTSRVSNLVHSTPFVYLRASRSNLPHDVVDDVG